MADPIDFSDLIPGGAPQAVQANPTAQGADPKLAFINDYLQRNGGSYSDAQAAWNASQPAPHAIFAPGAAPGATPTAAQETYARAAGPPSGLLGSANNPTYDYAGSQPAPKAAHVNQAGQLVDLNGVMKFDDLIPKSDPLADAAQSIPTAFVHGVTGMLGIPGNLAKAANSAIANGAENVFNSGALDRLAKLAGGTGSNGGHNPSHGLAQFTDSAGFPQSQSLNAISQQVTGSPLYQPRTWVGRAVDTIGQFAPAAVLGPEALGDKALAVVAPAAASDAAGEAARSIAPQWEDTARFIGGLGGGLGVGALAGAPGSAKVINAATGGLSDADIQAASNLGQTAQGFGFPLTMAEATAQATGKGSQLLNAQRAVENTPTGQAAFQPMLAARPAQMSGAVDNFITSNFGPPGASPSALAPRASGAAESALAAQRQAVNAQAQPFYASSRGDLIAPADYSALDGDPSYQQALQATRNDPERAHLIADLPDNAVGVVDAVGKRLNTLATQASGTELNPGDKQLGAIRQGAANRAFQIASASSPTYAQARQMVASGRASLFDPLQAGPVGQISKARSVGQQTGALFPSAPLPGAANETADALARLNALDPSTAPGLVGSYLGQQAGSAFSATKRGPDLYGGSGFALDVAGNPIQAQNLRAGIGAVAGPQVASDSDDLLQALLATGQRLPARSASPAEIAAALRTRPINASELGVTGGVLAEASHSPMGAVAALPLKAVTKGLDAISEARARSNAAELAQQLQAPPSAWATNIGQARSYAQRQNDMLAAALAGTAVQQQR